MNLKKVLTIICASLVWVGLAQAETNTNAAASEVTGTPKIACDQPVHDFGTKSDTETVNHAFVVKNVGDAPLLIKRVKASCGCTVVKPINNKTLKPGESVDVPAKFSLRNRRGKQIKTIRVYSNDPKKPTLTLKLTGTPKADIDVQPRYLNFRNISEGEESSQEIKITGNIDKPFKIISVSAVGKKLETELKTVEEGKAYSVKVTVPTNTPHGRLNDSIRIKTDYPKLPQIVVNTSAQISGPIKVIPESLVFVEDGGDQQALSKNIRLVPGKVKTFEVLDVKWPTDDVTFVRNSEASGGYNILVNNIIPNYSINGQSLIIKTDVPGMEEISIPITVRPRPVLPRKK